MDIKLALKNNLHINACTLVYYWQELQRLLAVLLIVPHQRGSPTIAMFPLIMKQILSKLLKSSKKKLLIISISSMWSGANKLGRKA